MWATPIGPLLVGWGINSEGQHRIDASVGASF